MPNERIRRSDYEARVGTNWIQGVIRKHLHILARNMPFPAFRPVLYRLAGMGIGSDTRIGLDSYLDDQFVSAVDVREDCTLEPRTGLVVHDETGMSAKGPGAFYDAEKGSGYVAHVTVETGAILGARTLLLPGVVVGEKAIVRPGSVVSRDVPSQAVALGSPARSIGSWQEPDVALSLLPSNYILREEYDARVPKSGWKLAGQYVLLMLARFTLPSRLRVALYRAMGCRVGRNVYIGVDTYLDERYPELITFEDGSGPSFRSTFVTHGETYDANGQRIQFVAPIVVKARAWAGSNSVFYPGVTVGEGAIVGSGSVVTEDIPDYAIAVGNPARVIKYRALPDSNESEASAKDDA